MNGIDLIDKPISIKDYKIYNICKLPKVFLGIRIKSKFDEGRVKIKPKYKPILISHFKTDCQLEPVFLHGIEITPKRQFSRLLNDLNNSDLFLSNTTRSQLLVKYTSMLDEYDLSCDTCYGFLSDGVYPVDTNCLKHLSQKDYTSEIDSGFTNILRKNEYPWYARLPNFNIFILCRTSGYNADYELNTNV